MRQRTLNTICCTLLTAACLWGCLPHSGNPMPLESARSSEWPEVRAAYLADHPKCEACGGREGLQVHHVTPFKTNPTRELDPTNLITLCTGDTCNCHLWIGHAGNFKTFNPSVREDAKRFREMIAARRPNQ